jgi:hypothetical protein
MTHVALNQSVNLSTLCIRSVLKLSERSVPHSNIIPSACGLGQNLLKVFYIMNSKAIQEIEMA